MPALVAPPPPQNDIAACPFSAKQAAPPQSDVSKCPFASRMANHDKVQNPPFGTYNPQEKMYTEEQKKILEAYPQLATVSCTEAFCEGGRMIHTTETRAGINRAVNVVQSEAVDFLRQLRRDGDIKTDDALRARIDTALHAIEKTSRLVDIRKSDIFPHAHGATQGVAGGTWEPTTAELDAGVKLAWKHSRRCIMRSEYKTLVLYDLRHVTTSKEMAEEWLRCAKEGFNKGDIHPSVMLFPPRKPGRSGPMIWNGQLLGFAGYELEDGSILGDPLNIDLTKAIIELGWTPPKYKSRFDVLPIVTMADDDEPYMMEVPLEDFPLVELSHPKYELEFQKMGLKWVATPALSRFAYDIGGLQFSAAPFMGWFLDAEIGTRDLADRFRYNVLPEVCVALGWVESLEALEDCSEYEKLAHLSRAQTELTYSATYSYNKAGVRISDSLSASNMFIAYDQEHLREFGYRLPSDPFWIAPPQGSVVPIWHLGGAPNYQPKPVICHHLEDPVRSWKRRTGQKLGKLRRVHPGGLPEAVEIKNDSGKRLIRIHYTSSGNTALKLANKVHSRLAQVLKDTPAGAGFELAPVQSLNSLHPQSVTPKDIVLAVASSSGRGEVPYNGQKLDKSLQQPLPADVTFALFGNGNSSYREHYNGAARSIHKLFVDNGATPLGDGFFESDAIIEDPPWNQLEAWVGQLRGQLFGEKVEVATPVKADATLLTNKTIAKYTSAKLVSVTAPAGTTSIRRVVFDVGQTQYETLSHVHILVPNQKNKVRDVVRALGIPGATKLELEGRPTVEDYLTDFVDLNHPFTDTTWMDSLGVAAEIQHTLSTSPVAAAVKYLPARWNKKANVTSVFASMPTTTARVYSVASAQNAQAAAGKANLMELLVTPHARGLFSSEYLTRAKKGTSIRVSFTTTRAEALLDDKTPVIAMATGSGVAPVQALLQRRTHAIKSGANPAPVTLVIGSKVEDVPTLTASIQGAKDAGVVDHLIFVPSNPKKERAQDKLFEDNIRNVVVNKIKNQDATIFACAGTAAANDFATNLTGLCCVNIKDALADKYIEETFEPAH